MGRRLGSGYELGVGRALRSNLAVFVEGDDVPIIAHLARRLNAKDVASSQGYATVPLGGFTRNSLASAFAETMAALGSTVSTVVVLDGDMRSPEAVQMETASMIAAGAHVHVWRRREIENYLLHPTAIAAVSGVSREHARTLLDATILGLEGDTRNDLLAQRMEERKLKGSSTSGHSGKTVIVNASKEFEGIWGTAVGRLAIVDAKAVLHILNSELQSRGAKTLNWHSLARSMPVAGIDQDVRDVVATISQCLGT